MSLTRPRNANEELDYLKKHRRLHNAELTMSGTESADYITIFFLFLKKAWLNSLRATAQLVLLPVIAAMELGQAAVAIYQARINKTPYNRANAAITGLSAAAVTSVVVGHLMFARGIVTAGTAFLSAALPWVLGGALVTRGLYHLVLALRCRDEARIYSEFSPENAKFRYAAKDHLLQATTSIIVGIVSTVLLLAVVTNPVALAIAGIVGGAVGAGYALNKLTKSAPGKSLNHDPAQDLANDVDEDDDEDDSKHVLSSTAYIKQSAALEARGPSSAVSTSTLPVMPAASAAARKPAPSKQISTEEEQQLGVRSSSPLVQYTHRSDDVRTGPMM